MEGGRIHSWVTCTTRSIQIKSKLQLHRIMFHIIPMIPRLSREIATVRSVDYPWHCGSRQFPVVSLDNSPATRALARLLMNSSPKTCFIDARPLANVAPGLGTDFQRLLISAPIFLGRLPPPPSVRQHICTYLRRREHVPASTTVCLRSKSLRG